MVSRTAFFPTSLLLLSLSIFLFVSHLPVAHSHALMSLPPQRGLLRGTKFAPITPVDPSAPVDSKPHFPAGDRDNRPGAGKLSQERATGFQWRPFTPESATYRWPAGVCGDLKGGTQYHMRGGKYYHNGMIVKEYAEGSVLESSMSVVAHHNGFVELRVCDVAKCGGEISEKCFRDNHCWLLQRTLEPSCESRVDPGCGPKDPENPGRWYVPCKTKDAIDLYGGPKMRFQLPPGLTCEHCVLHWYYGTANGCNPPGVIDYFEGPRGPKWGNCPGAAGAIGGYTKTQKSCGEPDKYAEEYFQCADIKISGTGSRGGEYKEKEPVMDTEQEPEPVSVPVEEDDLPPAEDESDAEDDSETGGNGHDAEPYDGKVVSLDVWVDGRVASSIRHGETKTVDTNGSLRIALEAATDGDAAPVSFRLNGRKLRTEWKQPYFMFGDIGDKPNYWGSPMYDEKLEIQVVANGGKTFRCWLELRR